MTVINGMKFNENEGALVADEQASTSHGRKYDTAEKLHDYSINGLTLIVGGTGYSDILYDISENEFRKWFDNYKENANKSEITNNGPEYLINNFNMIMLAKKRDLHNDHLFAKYGYTEEDILRGHRISGDGEKDSIHENVVREYFEGLGGIRVTLDHKIKFFNPFSHSLPFQSNPISIPQTIMEIKFSPEQKNQVADSLRSFHLTPKRHSKYLSGLSSLGLATYI